MVNIPVIGDLQAANAARAIFGGGNRCARLFGIFGIRLHIHALRNRNHNPPFAGARQTLAESIVFAIGAFGLHTFSHFGFGVDTPFHSFHCGLGFRRGEAGIIMFKLAIHMALNLALGHFVERGSPLHTPAIGRNAGDTSTGLREL